MNPRKSWENSNFQIKNIENIIDNLEFYSKRNLKNETYNNIKLGKLERKLIINYSNNFHLQYLNKRINGLNYLIKYSFLFDFEFNIMFKAIEYMDIFYLSLNNDCPIDEISLTCLLISFQFNGVCSRTKNSKLFLSFISNKVNNLFETESLILKVLKYNLCVDSCLDIINFIMVKYFRIYFEDISEKKNFLFLFYKNTFDFIMYIVGDPRYLDLKIYELSFCIFNDIIKLLFKTYRKGFIDNTFVSYYCNKVNLKKSSIVLKSIYGSFKK